jgi:hypothetical protein
MASKEELSAEINDKLDTDLDWSRMKKNELEHLNEMLDEGLLLERVAKVYAKNKGKDTLDEKIEDWSVGTIISKVI